MPVGILFCAILAALLIGVALWIFVRANRKKDAQASTDGPVKRSAQGWKSWIGYVGVALLLCLWSIVAAFFFLAVVWILRQNPLPDSILHIGDIEKRTARRIYTWLFLSPLLTVPCFIIALIYSYSGNPTNNQLVLAALAPLLLHLPLLLGLNSKSVFVYRHTQQGILLIALRATLAAIAITIGNDPIDGIAIFLFGNGLLWLFSSIWGWIEVRRGACWWMKQKRDALPSDKETVPPQVELLEQLSPEKYMEYGKSYLKQQRRDVAKKYALEAFRHGDPEIRREAVLLLDELNEVGFF